ncbi:MAG: glycosyltransferase family 4 protein [bacterium]|nr:glycosyltransferase family 4 protein [bacterium]
MTDGPIRILIIGTLPPPIGGASVLLQHLVDALSERNEIGLTVINTSGVRGNGIKGFFRLIGMLGRIVTETRKSQVITLHAATSGLHFIGPIAYGAARLWGRPLLLRKFGGTDHRDKVGVKGRVIRWIVHRTNLFLVETKMLIDAAKEDGITRVAWYPNNRPFGEANELASAKPRPCRRFVFMSHVRPVKGVAELIDAAERFGEEVTVDVYGPFRDGLSEEIFAGRQRVHYKGVVSPDEVAAVLREYDALLLPTYHPGEGYPGIVLEAYRAGLPVVTTRWRAVPEIVDDTCGILVEPRNVDALHEAMRSLVENEELFNRLRAGVRAKREMFDTATWAERLVEMCRELAHASETRHGPV